jgi:hypothetical protein
MKVGVLNLSLSQFQKIIEDRLDQISYNLNVENPKRKIAEKISEMHKSLHYNPVNDEDSIYGEIDIIT